MEVTNSFQQYLNYPASISKTIERYNEAGALQWSENYDFDNMPTAVFPTSNGDIHFVFENNGTASLAVPDCTTQQNCPDDIAGFEYLGEYNGHQYFLSDDAERPTDAQDIAEQNGGYLVVINDHAENDFLQQGISEMIYIGLNDAQTEGSPQWVNGSSSYSNYDICSFCNENSNNLDYVVMHNWNGGWSWSSQWNSRKYIVEIPCGNISPNTYPICSGANTQTFEKEIDLPNQTQIVDILENPTCGYFGVAMENNGYLVHLDHEGEYRWIKPITNGLDINSIGIRFLPNAEGFLIYGIMNNPEQFFMIKIDNAANVIWENIYNNINAIYHQPAILNSGEILCLNGNGDLIKFDADGNYLWANSDLIQSATTATPIYKTLSRIHELQDGHVMMIGYEADYSSYVPLPDIRIIKIDGEANVVFDKTINACCNRSGEYANIQATEVRPDGSIGLVLSSASNPGAYPISKLLERYTINPDGSFAGGGFCFPNTVNGNYSVVDVAFTSSNQIVVVGNFCSEYQQSTLFPPPPVSSCGGTSNFAVGCDAQNYQGNRQVSGTADGGILAVGGLNFVAKLNGNGTLNLTGNSSIQNTLISTIVNTQVVDDKFGNILLKELMPNPANERIFVSLYSPIEDNVELQIFDARGVLVKTEQTDLQDGDNTVDISIQDLPSGFYFLKIPQAQAKHSTVRFVKVRD